MIDNMRIFIYVHSVSEGTKFDCPMTFPCKPTRGDWIDMGDFGIYEVLSIIHGLSQGFEARHNGAMVRMSVSKIDVSRKELYGDG